MSETCYKRYDSLPETCPANCLTHGSPKTTHLLKCRACRGTYNCTDYTMDCNILKKMPDGRLKVEVFGERNWNRSHKKRSVRYVPDYKVIKNPNV